MGSALRAHARRVGRDAQDASRTGQLLDFRHSYVHDVLLIGPAPATITASLEALAISCFLSRDQRRVTRVLFNVAAVGLAMSVAGGVWTLLDDSGSWRGGFDTNFALLLLATVATIGTYFLVNTWIVALAVALEHNERVYVIWKTHFLRLGLAYGAGAYTALLLAIFTPSEGVRGFLLLAPMPLILYAALRTWLGRVNDQMAHLDTVKTICPVCGPALTPAQRRVAAYERAVQPFFRACRAADVSALPLRLAHARMVEMAERLLPHTVDWEDAGTKEPTATHAPGRGTDVSSSE
jgi:hypothetical protein